MKRYLKLTFVIIFVFVLFINFEVLSSAANESDIYSSIGTDNLYESIPQDVRSLLSELGVDEVDFDSIFNIKAKDIWLLCRNLLTGAVESPLKSMFRLFAVIIFVSICESFIQDEAKMKYIIEMYGTLFCVITVIKPLSVTVSSAVSSILSTEAFMLVLVPVLTAVVSAAGNPGLAVSFQSIAFIAAQIISGVASRILVPLVGVILALDISGTMIPMYKLGGITGFIKKTMTSGLSVCATVYVAFLGLKGTLANAADTFTTKGIKLIISSVVPVVGGALSETYSGIMGSMVLAKSTIGIFGIGAIALINLPSCMQLVFWILTFRASNALAELFEQHGLAVFFKALASTFVLLNAVILFVAVLFVISTALILVIKAG